MHVSTQAARHVAHQIAKRFDIPYRRVHLVAEHVGGGFGAKQWLTPETVAAIGSPGLPALPSGSRSLAARR